MYKPTATVRPFVLSDPRETVGPLIGHLREIDRVIRATRSIRQRFAFSAAAARVKLPVRVFQINRRRLSEPRPPNLAGSRMETNVRGTDGRIDRPGALSFADIRPRARARSATSTEARLNVIFDLLSRGKTSETKFTSKFLEPKSSTAGQFSFNEGSEKATCDRGDNLRNNSSFLGRPSRIQNRFLTYPMRTVARAGFH